MADIGGLGAGRVPAHLHHMYYDGPMPHQHHAAYDEYSAREREKERNTQSQLPLFDDGEEIDPSAARHHHQHSSTDSSVEPPAHYPPAQYHHEHPYHLHSPNKHQQADTAAESATDSDSGFIDEVPSWMFKGYRAQQEQQQHLGANTAQEKWIKQQQAKQAKQAEAEQKKQAHNRRAEEVTDL